MRLVPNAVGGSGSGPILGKFSKIYSHLILEPVFAGLKLTKNCYINMNISFSGKEPVLLKTGFTSLSYKHTVSERLSSQFRKIWINGDLKNPSVSNYLLNWENLETQTRLILKKNNNVFVFFINEEKLGSLTRAKLIYPKSLFESGKSLETWRPTLKNINFESIDKMGNVKF